MIQITARLRKDKYGIRYLTYRHGNERKVEITYPNSFTKEFRISFAFNENGAICFFAPRISIAKQKAESILRDMFSFSTEQINVQYD